MSSGQRETGSNKNLLCWSCEQTNRHDTANMQVATIPTPVD